MIQSSRRQTRNRLYVIAILPSVLLLMASGRIVLALHAESSGLDNYARSDYSQAQARFEANGVLNPFQRWVAPFGEGVARHSGDDLAGAVGSYRNALDYVPQSWECAVRGNLALALEAMGDTALETEGRLAAEQSWLLGREALENCLVLDLADQGNGDRSQLARHSQNQAAAFVTDTRLSAKLSGARPGDAPRPDVPLSAEADLAERQRQLEERDRRSLKQRYRLKQAGEERRSQRSRDPGETPPVPTW